jgi:hypothetical protein
MGGRQVGSVNKRTEEGRETSRAILVQDESELEVREIGLTFAFGDSLPPVGSGRTEVFDRHPLALANPVIRRLREQARAGVGSIPGSLPTQVWVHLMDRLFGKVVDRMKLLDPKRPYGDLTDAELAERARLTASAFDAG